MAQLNLTGKLFSIYINDDKPTQEPVKVGDVFQAEDLHRWYVHLDLEIVNKFIHFQTEAIKTDKMFVNYDLMREWLTKTFGKVNFR